ncbi:MAG: siderophore biosynthesis protein [Alteromonadaceae bacterium]|nr:siderophore biosynthesis protein [Alteromonadaceae bacterium]
MSSTNRTHWQNKLFEQYLNTFLRELGVDICEHLQSSASLPHTDAHNDTDDGLWFAYCFTASGTTLHGRLRHLSLTGYHRYGPDFWMEVGSTTMPLASLRPLLRLISVQLAVDTGGEAVHVEAAATLYESMYKSVENSRFFLEERQQRCGNLSVVDGFTAAEQGMVLGHPFHVTSKASSGFTETDMRRYSPELGASFQLHYFAVVPAVMDTQSSGTAVTDLVDPAARDEAERRLGSLASQYQLLPCHPWQAEYLLAREEVRSQLDTGAIISLGPLGQVVWPTSSVRTVWLPESGLFLKLSLDVRITNFIRNNPPDQSMRAIDASRLIKQLTSQTRENAPLLLPELAAQTVRISGLEASFGILYRAGLKPEALAQTRVLGALVEECPTTGELPLRHYIQQAAKASGTPVTGRFVRDWWRQYLKVSLLPVLELFAQSGISLEAHLQNCLMRFDQGLPVQLVVRDMEGTSVSTDSPLAVRCPEVGPDSPVWYSPDDAWFRFKYYLMVNHIAHLAAAIARACPVSEAALWHVAGQLLTDAELSDPGRHYARQLLQASHLPAKANMLSTFAGSGEKPTWVQIVNPLYDYRPTGFTPLADTGFASAFRLAEQRVIRQLLEALLFEKVLPYQLSQNKLTIPVSSTLSYQGRAASSFSFGRLRIRQDSLRRIEAGQPGIPSLDQVMQDLDRMVGADPERWQPFHDELTQTLIKHAQALQFPPTRPLRELPYCEQEARVTNGHLYHPSFKSRIGFDLTDNQRYGPEQSTGFTLIWLAVDEDLAQVAISRTTSLQALQCLQFGTVEYQAIEQQILAAGGDPKRMVLMPVHPWQWQRVIRVHYLDLLEQNRVIRLEVKGPDYLPQQSVRTLSNVSDLQAPSLKLAMSLVNTSTSRVLAPHTVHNAAPISDWLWQLVQDDDLLPEAHKPIMLREIAGVSVIPPYPVQAQYGALACIWRESVCRYLSPGQSATPVTALMQLDIDQRPLIDPWIGRHGLEDWVDELIERVYLPVMHMLWRHGTALESHAQNMLLIHQDGWPVRVALKDFHDGVRYCPDLLANPGIRPQLTDAPPAHARINPNSFLETGNADELRDFTQDALCFVNLAELAWFLSDHYGLPEIRFWSLVKQVVLRYQSAHPQLASRFELFDFFAPGIDVEQLASRRFLPEIRLRNMTVANPLDLED